MNSVFENNLSEYEDPEKYDLENNPFLDDVAFLMKWIDTVEGPIIDLACGTGRATIPLAQRGCSLIGVDLHEGMLSWAVEKSRNLALPIRWVKQDCSKLELQERSNLIYMVGNSFQHFLTNRSQTELLTSVYRHLNPQGLFIFSIRFPNAEELLAPSDEEYWRSYKDEQGNTVDMYTVSSYDAIAQVQLCTTIRRTKDEEGRIVKDHKSDISLRFTFPQEMERLLAETGFDILHSYGDWQGNVLTSDSHSMVYVAQKK